MSFDRDDETVAEAFASLKASASEQFPPPPVHELMQRGPAALRRRRLVSVAAVVGACTAVTAGGFAVASTLGPLASGPESAETGTAVTKDANSEDEHYEPSGSPAAPEGEDGEPATATTPPGDVSAIVLGGPFTGTWADACATGPQEADFATWTITADTGWSIDAVAEGDADGDGDAETVLALTCENATGVAAFTMDEESEDGPVLSSFAWVWQPEGTAEFEQIVAVESGEVVLNGTSADTAWTERFAWDGESFAPVEVPPTADPTTPSETPSSPTPSDTPTTDAASATTATSS
ncbi:hypothetical protein AB0B28_03700 [Glycomyces sp. NPDC046736]|uniref:hypothetical protein n=1 Tax=Glycomyces sp. NPDC046736 TaxID=3155615 RepID=UPI0033FDBE8F